MTAAPSTLTDPSPQHLHPSAVTLWRLSSAANYLFLIAAALVAARLGDFPAVARWAAAPIAVAGAISMVFYAPARWRAWTFEVGADDVRLRHGVLWRRESVVPHVRIQHVDTRHGPIERWLGLASVIIFTAGRVGGALTIPALPIAEAEALRDHLAALSGRDDAV